VQRLVLAAGGRIGCTVVDHEAESPEVKQQLKAVQFFRSEQPR